MQAGAETTLLTAVSDLSSARELTSVTAVVRVAARALTGADGVTFVLKEQEHCFYADEDAISPLWKGRRFPLRTCISGWVMRYRTPVAIRDIYQDDRIPHDAYRPTFVKSLLMVPVRSDDPVAAIGAYWADEHDATDGERSTLEALARAASLALVNVQLWSDLTSALAREQTARVEAERAQVAAETANQLKDQFLATVSHELRTPLNVMQGWLWQLDRGMPPPDRFKVAISTLQRNTALQAKLIEDLLDVSRAVSGRLALDLQPIDLSWAVRGAVESAEGEARKKGVSLTCDIAPALPVVHADAERVGQITRNLLSNAVKFTPSGGRVDVHVESSPTGVALTVNDTGVGIPSDFLPFVFDRFRQADGRATRRFGGLGIGLTIVQQLVALHGGTVAASSEGENRGTSVRVQFPVLRTPSAAPVGHDATQAV
jgi:two-component system CheB/CheR fusion protein